MSLPEVEAADSDGTAQPRVEQNYGVREAHQNGGIIAGAARAFRLFFGVLFRLKSAEEGLARLPRVLSALDLTALSLGSTLGVGVYVLVGVVAKNYAGPAVILSFLLAAVANFLAGLCYAELGARVPKAGSAYDYSYVCVGEFIAFNIGWSLMLVYIVGAASVAKALSQYLDSLLDKAISTNLEAIMPLDSPYLARYPDLIAFAVVILFSVGLALGVKNSTRFNNFCTSVNLCVIIFVIISLYLKADIKNWRIAASDVPKPASKNFGSGGFAPYGVAGIIKGAAVCFHGFIGFDSAAAAGEEAAQPARRIPLAIVFALLLALLACCGLAAVLTLVMPYFMADEEEPFQFVYEQLGWPWAGRAVSAGLVCALCSRVVGAVFSLGRTVYAMATDGLLWRCAGRVSARFQTPLVATIVPGLFTGILAMFFELEQLIQMMSIGTLLAYSMVAACVLLLRYKPEDEPETQSGHRPVEPLGLSVRAVLRQLVNADRLAAPTRLSAATVTALVTLYGICSFVVMSCVNHYGAALWSRPGALAVFASGSLLVVATLFAISRQPVSEKKLAFSVPLVPWLPGLSILVNVYLMLTLDYMTWLRFSAWIAAGVLMYATYGVWHSLERRHSLRVLPGSRSRNALLADDDAWESDRAHEHCRCRYRTLPYAYEV